GRSPTCCAPRQPRAYSPPLPRCPSLQPIPYTGRAVPWPNFGELENLKLEGPGRGLEWLAPTQEQSLVRISWLRRSSKTVFTVGRPLSVNSSTEFGHRQCNPRREIRAALPQWSCEIIRPTSDGSANLVFSGSLCREAFARPRAAPLRAAQDPSKGAPPTFGRGALRFFRQPRNDLA